MIIVDSISFREKNGEKGILSIFIGREEGFEDPVRCNIIRWMKTNAVTTKGKIKWIEKNRFKVGLSTENPPHTHWTIVFPISGITDKKFVMTDVPQNDIWPHGSTYPTNAVIIRIRKIVIPVIHVSFNLKELKVRFFKMWR